MRYFSFAACLCALVIIVSMARGQQPAQPARHGFEYCTLYDLASLPDGGITASIGPDHVLWTGKAWLDGANFLGKSGWELVSIQHGADGDNWYFKRAL